MANNETESYIENMHNFNFKDAHFDLVQKFHSEKWSIHIYLLQMYQIYIRKSMTGRAMYVLLRDLT